MFRHSLLAVIVLILAGCGAHRAHAMPPPPAAPATPQAQAQYLLTATETPDDLTPADVAALVPIARALAAHVLHAPAAPLAAPPSIDYLAPLKRDAGLAVEWGAIVGMLGAILWIASAFVPVTAIGAGAIGWLLSKVIDLSTIWRVATSCGGVAVCLGAGLLWAFDHPWAIVLSIASAVLWFAWVHHKDIAATWHAVLTTVHGTTSTIAAAAHRAKGA